MTMRAQYIALTIILAAALFRFLCPREARAADTPEYWAEINKDGNWRNSNARSIQGSLRSRWARSFHNYWVIDTRGGQRSNNVTVRDGRVLLIVPSSAPEASYSTGHFATYGTYALSNGAFIQSVLSPQVSGGGVFVPGGIMDSDMMSGLVNAYWQPNGEVFTGHGSDHAGFYRFSAYTGERSFGAPPGYFAGPSTPNVSGYFAMSNSNPSIFAIGGQGGHESTNEPGVGGLLGSGLNYVSSMKHYASFAVEGNMIYPLYVTNIKSGYEGYGVQIQGVQFTPSPYSSVAKWSYSDPNKSFLAYGGYHCSGAPRAYCLGEDGRLYYYGYNTKGSGASQSPDFSKGVLLAGIQSSDGTNDLNIPVNYNPESETPGDTSHTGWNLAVTLMPQIATRGSSVIVFQPQQVGGSSNYANGHLFCFDTVAKTLRWRFDFPAGYFKSNTDIALNHAFNPAYSPEQAVQAVIAGDSVYVVDPSAQNGGLNLRIEKFLLSDGTRTTTTIVPTENAQQIPIASGSQLALREVAAVDSTLVCLVDYGTSLVTDQALVVIDGSSTPALNYSPVAVISAPVTGTPLLHQQHLTDYPAPPTNQFDSNNPIAFSSTGSFDPNGGPALTYLWNFGDGATSTQANPTHTYASGGSSPAVTTRTVTLQVTNSAGNVSTPATRLLAVRDVGTVQTNTYSAIADAYVDASSPDSNFGTAAQLFMNSYSPNNTGPLQRSYLRFNLSPVPANIQSATLRVFAQNTLINNMQVRACANTWNETSITFNNAPPPGNGVGYKTFVLNPSSAYYVDIPVTTYVKTIGSDGLISFALELTDNNNSALLLSSREGIAAPQLILQSGNPGYSGPTIVNQPQDTSGSTLSILGASTLSQGEAGLSYSWYTVSGPGVVKFTPNNNNAAKLTTMWSASPGPFVVQCIVSDGLQSVASRLVTVSPAQTVNVNITSASQWYTLPANVIVTSSATASYGNISRVDYYANGTFIGSSTTASNYGISWSVPAVSYYFITATAVGDRGATATSSPIVIRVSSTTIDPPYIVLTSPADGSIFNSPGPISLSANAAPFESSAPAIARVEFYQGNTLLGSVNSPPYNWTWNNVSAGTYVLTARAIDVSGAMAPSVPATITVTGTLGAPVINSPLSVSGTVGAAFNYTISATNGPVSFNASGLPAGLTVNTATGLISGTPTAAATSNVTISASNGSGTGQATLVLTISPANQPPVITSAPSATPNPALVGQTVTFAVAASDPDGNPLTFAWTFGDASSGNGASVTHAYNVAGTFTASVTVSDGLGGTATGSVTVTVNTAAVPPSITTQPASQSVTVGQSATFNVVATGTAPLSYQWKKNGANISGATAASYTTPATTSSDNGAIFAVVVSNSVGSVTSGNATLTVNTSSGPVTVVLQDGLNGYSGTRDTYLDGGTNANWGAQSTLYGSLSAGGLRPMVRFAIFQSEGGPVPSGVTIQSATLSLYRTSPYDDSYTLNRVLRDWKEQQATWSSANSTTPWTTPGAGGSGTDIAAGADATVTTPWMTGWIDFDVTNGVAAFSSGTSNFGWRVLDNLSGNLNSYNSREFATDPTLRPKLKIVYQTGTPPPVITSALTANATVGAAFSYSITATNSPTSFNAVGLPAGLSVNTATGVISGTPSASGTFGVTLSASNAGGTGTATLNLTIGNSGTPTTVVLQDGLNGYSGTKDTFLDGGTNANWGSQPTMYGSVSGGGLRPMVRFAIFQSEGGPVPNGATIQAATLSLYRTSPYDDSYTVSRALKNWNELEATWNNANATTPWTTAGAGAIGSDIASTPDSTLSTPWMTGWINLDVTSGVAAFSAGTANNGWRVLDALSGNINTYCARNYSVDPTQRPKLTVVYQTSAGAALAAESTMMQPQSLTVSHIQGAASFSTQGRDSIAIQGSLSGIPKSFAPAGTTVTLSIGGAGTMFTLDSKGRGKTTQGSIAVNLKSGKSGMAAFTAKVQHGSWTQIWNLDKNKSITNAPMNWTVIVRLGDQTCVSAANVLCTAKANVGAKLKE